MWPRVLAGMAVIVVLIGLLGFGVVQLRHAGSIEELRSLVSHLAADEPTATTSISKPVAQETETAVPTPVEPAAPAVRESHPDEPAASGVPPTAAPNAVPAAQESERLKPLHGPAHRPTQAPSTLTTTLTPSERPSPRLKSDLVDTPVSQTERVVPQPLSSGAPSGPPLAQSRPPAEAVALAMTNGSPTPIPTTGSDAGRASVPAIEAPAAVPDAPARSESKYDESLRIRAVLLRYENAYNRLDAKAASSVWPGVDQTALDRAFSGLISQKVSLGLCDITVLGDIGTASCAGKARWEPKVGGGLQTADRHWDFQLRKTGEGWRIQEIRVR